MIRIILFALLFTAIFVSCKKEKSGIYEVQKVHPAPQEMMAQFKNALNSGPLAWQVILNPKSGKSYTMFLKMDKVGNVWTLLDLDVSTARQAKHGTYKLDTSANHASINFSAGTYFDDITHKEGFRTLGADTSYAFKYMNADTIVLLGNRNGDELKLINISAEEQIDFEQGVLGNAYIYMYNFFTKKPYFSFETPENGPVQVALDVENRGMVLYYGNKGKLAISSSDYSYGINKIILKKPIIIGNYFIRELTVDIEFETFYISSGNSRFELLGANMPLIPLHLLIGNVYQPFVSLPSPYFVETLPGWSESFHDIWLEATENLLYDAGAELLIMSFNLNIEKDLMNLEVFFAGGGRSYKAIFPFRYVKSEDGVYSFDMIPFEDDSDFHENAHVIKPYLFPLLNLIQGDSFKMKLFDYGGNNFLAQMTSVERPEIFFTGYMVGYELN